MTPNKLRQRTWEAKFKAIETDWNDKVDPGTYTLVRVDGRAFSTLTKRLNQPYSMEFIQWMNDVAVALCYEMQGAVFAYVQSDEVSVLMTDFKPNQGRWFEWNVNKMVSIAAATATAAFNIGYQHDENETLWLNKKPALFDARVVPLEHRMDVIQYFLWRQRDAYINGISMLADKLCGSAALDGKNLNERIDLLFAQGVEVKDIPLAITRGRIVEAHKEPGTVEYTHKKTGETLKADVIRNNWKATQAPWFDWDEAGFLEQIVPHKITA